MANTIRIKRRASNGAVGAPTTLAPSELAYNEADNTLYYGFGDGGVGFASSVISVAGSGGFVTTGSTQTVSGPKTFSCIFNAFSKRFLAIGVMAMTQTLRDPADSPPTVMWFGSPPKLAMLALMNRSAVI